MNTDAGGGGSSSEGVEYIAYTVSGSTATANTQTATDYTEWTGTVDPTSISGTYVVTGAATCTGTLTMTGDVNIILCDGASLTITEGIADAAFDLKIYGQSAGTGTLTTSSTTGHSIGVTNLEVHGGTITASSSADSGLEATNDFLLFDGTVNSSSTSAAGIMTTTFKFYGGYVEAVGSTGSNGISCYTWPVADYIFNYSGATIKVATSADGADWSAPLVDFDNNTSRQCDTQGIAFPPTIA